MPNACWLSGITLNAACAQYLPSTDDVPHIVPLEQPSGRKTYFTSRDHSARPSLLLSTAIGNLGDMQLVPLLVGLLSARLSSLFVCLIVVARAFRSYETHWERARKKKHYTTFHKEVQVQLHTQPLHHFGSISRLYEETSPSIYHRSVCYLSSVFFVSNLPSCS
ncbi:hypothetical protein QR685DRAFT_159484 [Neurospora intermedia]|uniref:Uncharacterized protein n=1 Tax=Neurospora intermedia TaxID=5142 RepID=A0ABR3DK01_NEUIN